MPDIEHEIESKLQFEDTPRISMIDARAHQFVYRWCRPECRDAALRELRELRELLALARSTVDGE